MLDLLYECYKRGKDSANAFHKRRALRARAMFVTKLDRYKNGEPLWRK